MTNAMQPEYEDEALVAEYVVGVLPADERQVLADRIARDPAIRARILAWETHMDAFNETYGTLAVPAVIKTRIDRKLFGEKSCRFSPSGWFFGTLTGLIATVMAAVVLVWTFQSPDQSAILANDNGDPVVIVDTRGNTLRIAQAALRPPVGSVFELWAVVPDQVPLSLGTFSAAGSLQLTAGLADGVTLAVSIEPTGGSPTGVPTGPVIATGVLTDV